MQATPVVGPIHLTRLLLPGMLKRNYGKVVNKASIVGHRPFPGATVYATAQAGVLGFPSGSMPSSNAVLVSHTQTRKMTIPPSAP
jgi:hypothetical protein